MRLREHRLAAAAGVATGRGVGAPAPGGTGPAGTPGAARLVPGVPRRGQRAGEKGGELTGPNPTDRGKPGSKYHILVDAAGVPLAALLSAANTHDSKLFEPLLDAAPAVKCPGRGRPRRRPAKLHADKGYDVPRCRAYLRQRGITARIARRGVESTERARPPPLGGRTIGLLAASLQAARAALRPQRAHHDGSSHPGLRAPMSQDPDARNWVMRSGLRARATKIVSCPLNFEEPRF